MRNMAFAAVGNVLIALHNTEPPTEQEWIEYTETIKRMDVTKIRCIAFSDGGGPNSKQRKILNDMIAGRPTSAAVVSSSAVVRSVVTALNWFNPLVKAFAPDCAADAYRYLNLTPSETDAVRQMVRALSLRFTPGLKCIVL